MAAPLSHAGSWRRQVAQFAAALVASGIKPGDAVSLADANTVGAATIVAPQGFSYMHVKRRLGSTCTRLAHSLHLSLSSCIGQAEFVVAFLGITWARAVAAPLNQNYKQVRIRAMPHLLTLLHLDHHRQGECIEIIHAVALQDEFAFYLEDANSKLLVVPASGNAAAEAAAQHKRVPVATFRLPSGKLLDFNVHGRTLCWSLNLHNICSPLRFWRVQLMLRGIRSRDASLTMPKPSAFTEGTRCRSYFRAKKQRYDCTGSGEVELRAKSREAHIAQPQAQQHLDAAQPDDVGLFLHTSGTTGKPKVGFSNACEAQILGDVLSFRNSEKVQRQYSLSSIYPQQEIHRQVPGDVKELRLPGVICSTARLRLHRACH